MNDQEMKAKAFDYINTFLTEADVWSFSADKIEEWNEYAKSLIFQICGTVDFVEYLVKQMEKEDCTEEIDEKDTGLYII